jgi:hypothetical protein
VNRSRLVAVLGTVFAALAVFLGIAGVAVEPLLLLLAVPFGVVAYFMWYQASGRLVERVYAGVEGAARVDEGRRPPGGDGARGGQGGRGGFGAGPREEWDPAGEWARRERVSDPRGGGRRGGRQRRRQRQRRRAPRTNGGPTAAEAYDILGLDPEADQGAVRRAYRERVKTAHPDTDEGSEEEFKRVNAAYERLSD